ncbi:MAG: phenylacetate--CoA ligase family protein [Candidatus Binatia bacterium]
MASLWRKAGWNAFTVWHARKEQSLPYVPLEKIIAVQTQRLQDIVAHAYETVPYYRKVMDAAGLLPKDIQSADDLTLLPIITSEQLAQNSDQFLSLHYRKESGITLHSSGTSGMDKFICYDPTALFLALAHGHRQRLVLAHFTGQTFGYREVNAVRSHSVSVQLRDFYESYSWTPRKIDFRRSYLLPGGVSLTENIAQLNSAQPDVIRGYGSYIGSLFRWAWTHNLPLHRPKVVIYGADHMAEADRRLIEEAFSVPVLSTYQATEALRIAFQCEHRQGFHIFLDDVVLRVVDDHGHPVSPGGTGHLILSNLTNKATVLLNYKLGDMVTLNSSPCPCGRTLPLIQDLHGRSDDFLVLPRGQLLHSLVVLEKIQNVADVVQIQVRQEDLQRFRLLVVYAGNTAWSVVKQQIDAAMRTVCGSDIAVSIEQVETIVPEPGGKVKLVVSQCRL